MEAKADILKMAIEEKADQTTVDLMVRACVVGVEVLLCPCKSSSVRGA